VSSRSARIRSRPDPSGDGPAMSAGTPCARFALFPLTLPQPCSRPPRAIRKTGPIRRDLDRHFCSRFERYGQPCPQLTRILERTLGATGKKPCTQRSQASVCAPRLFNILFLLRFCRVSLRIRGKRARHELVHQLMQAFLPAQMKRAAAHASPGDPAADPEFVSLVVRNETPVRVLHLHSANITRDCLTNHRRSRS